MSVAVIRYLEPLNADERAFLKRKETRDRRQFYRVLRILLPICFALPFAMAWGKAIAGLPNPFSYASYFIGVSVLLFLTLGGAAVAYRSNLYLLHQDLRHNTKTVERATITSKRFMPHTNTCFFYLDSAVKLSVEVSEQYFKMLSAGDELNIEYATHSKAYFGYF
jgi:hypothetical protein